MRNQITYQIRARPVRPQPGPDATRAGLNTEMKGPFTRYGVDVVVSLEDFAFDATPDGVRRGRIEAMLIAYDRNGKIANIVKLNSGLALEPTAYAELHIVPSVQSSYLVVMRLPFLSRSYGTLAATEMGESRVQAHRSRQS